MAKTLFGGAYELPPLDPVAFAAALAAVPSRGEGARKRPSIFPPRRKRVPLRRSAFRDRRVLAATGMLPPQIAADYRPSEQAVLAVIGEEIRRQGFCALSIDEIGDRAGVSRTTVQNTLRAAVDLGLIERTLRPRRGHVNNTNIITAKSAEWSFWLSRRKGRLQPLKGLSPLDTRKIQRASEGVFPSPTQGFAGTRFFLSKGSERNLRYAHQ